MAVARSPSRKSKRPAREVLTAYAEAAEIELLFLDPPEHFDAAILGVVYGFGQEPAVLYDETAVLVAMEQSGMSPEDAREFFDFNTAGAFLGPATPRFLVRP